MVLSLINVLRLDSKTESESTNRTDIGNPSRWCTAYYTSRSRLAALLNSSGVRRAFVEDKQIEDDQCLVK
jgi:hypothetical protein